MRRLIVFVMLIFMPISFAREVTSNIYPILFVMADKDFYDPEYFIPKEALESLGYKTKVATPSGGISKGLLRNEVTADLSLSQVNEQEYTAIVLVGGTGGVALYDNPELIALVKSFNDSKKLIGAQCVTPVVLAQAGLLQGQTATCWSNYAEKLQSYGVNYSNELIVAKENIITAQAGSDSNINVFTDKLINLLGFENPYKKIKSAISENVPDAPETLPVVAGQNPYNYKGQLPYLLYLPEEYTGSGAKFPLIVFLHGMGERGDNTHDLENVAKHGLPNLLSSGFDLPAVVVSPLCPSEVMWPAINDRLEKLLEFIENNYAIDRSRVYLTGLSMGGHGVWHLGLKIPEQFAAIVPVAGFYNFQNNDVPENIADLKNTPIWVFHGAQDDVVPFMRSETMVHEIKQLGGNIKFTIYPEGKHDTAVWTETYSNPDLYKWLFEQKKSENTHSALVAK